jgi:hypothetical protein
MNGNDNAFPGSPDKYEPEFGLTKRELIAAMAMQGFVQHTKLLFLVPEAHDREAAAIASVSVKMADALIERLSADPVAEGLNLLPLYSRELDEGLGNDQDRGVSR